MIRRALLILKHLALHDLVDQRPQAVILVARSSRRSPRSRGSIGRLRALARGVGQQLLGQRPGELVLVLQQQLLELVDVLEPLAVRHHVGRIDLRDP